MDLVPQIILERNHCVLPGNYDFLITRWTIRACAVSVPPDAFQSVYDQVMKWDEAA
jgi:hypothetical protein